jgi:peptidoglycan/LPS O-acetylase OafA/YrhL
MAARAGNPTLLFTAGGSGVDIFFAISGFVMVTVTEPVWGRGGIAWTFSSAD